MVEHPGVFAALGHLEPLVGVLLYHLMASCLAVVGAVVGVEEGLLNYSSCLNTVDPLDSRDNQAECCLACHREQDIPQERGHRQAGAHNVHSWDLAAHHMVASAVVLDAEGEVQEGEALEQLQVPSFDCTSCVLEGPLGVVGTRSGPSELPFYLMGAHLKSARCQALSGH